MYVYTAHDPACRARFHYTCVMAALQSASGAGAGAEERVADEFGCCLYVCLEAHEEIGRAHV